MGRSTASGAEKPGRGKLLGLEGGTKKPSQEGHNFFGREKKSNLLLWFGQKIHQKCCTYSCLPVFFPSHSGRKICLFDLSTPCLGSELIIEDPGQDC